MWKKGLKKKYEIYPYKLKIIITPGSDMKKIN